MPSASTGTCCSSCSKKDMPRPRRLTKPPRNRQEVTFKEFDGRDSFLWSEVERLKADGQNISEVFKKALYMYLTGEYEDDRPEVVQDPAADPRDAQITELLKGLADEAKGLVE